ncbi:MAG: glycosyltransferase family protein [Ignavibacteria bacterium]|nr:glycosyltransferase family protein [Ignavibacteria bacterium]
MIERVLNIVTIIQARTGSTRMPGKVMLEAAGKPLLLHMIERVQQAKFAGKIVVATTCEPEDDIIAELCAHNNVECFRGSTNDLLDRHYKAALSFSADVVLKIPSDCPLIDPAVIDRVIEYFIRHRNQFDYVSNLHPATYPDGFDVEIFSFNALYKACRNAYKEYEREHTTPFIWNNPGMFKLGNIAWETGKDLSRSHRFVLDYSEDFYVIKEIFERLYYSNKFFTLEDIIDLISVYPLIGDINKHLNGKTWYNEYLHEFNKVSKYSGQLHLSQ